jgi:hypothetical protein
VRDIENNFELAHHNDTTMFLRSISSIFKVNRRHLYKTANESLFACNRKQIRQLSTPDPKETSAIDPFNYKVETYNGIYEDHTGKRKNRTQIPVKSLPLIFKNEQKGQKLN